MEAEMRTNHSFRINRLIHGANDALNSIRILIVGVGGIGCEILKVLSKSPIGSVHILDMDTIEVLILLHSYPISIVNFCLSTVIKECQNPSLLKKVF